MPPIEVVPSAKRLIKSLRDMGYDFSQAVADVVDNSIEAAASLVAIDIEFDGDDSWVRISDNGRGMKPEELREAMRFGSERSYENDALGKFGLGLKTASMSQCQLLSVASRWNADRADISAYSWDLDHIERTNRWEILPIERNGLGPAIRAPLKDSTGTVVLWRRLDRILGYKHPYGELARRRLSAMCRDLELHLGMVFHRFLSGDARGKKLALLLNGNEVKPWDPFCRTESKTKRLQPIRIDLEHEGVFGHVLVEPFVLPHQDDFSSADAFRAASGPANWNQQQGFYIYRAGRMIQSGGWSNLHAPDEHMKLARVAVGFSPALDDAFQINVPKMRVQLPSQIRDEVRSAIVSVRRLARETYDRKPNRVAGFQSGPLGPNRPHTGDPAPEAASRPMSPTLSPNSFARVAETGPSYLSPVKMVFTYDEWSARMLALASELERPIVEQVLIRLRLDGGAQTL